MFHVITPPHPEFTEAQPPQGQARVETLAKFCSRIHSKPHPASRLLATDSLRLCRALLANTINIHTPDEKPSLAKAKGFENLQTSKGHNTVKWPHGNLDPLSSGVWSYKKGSPPSPDLITPKLTCSPMTATSALSLSVPTLSSLSSVLG